MKLTFDFLVLSAHFALLCSVRILTQATDLLNEARGQDVSRRGQEGNDVHKLLELEKNNELELELLKLKHSVNEDKADPISVSSSSLRDKSRGGQPEYANEDVEGLTGIRPLEIPIHLTEVGSLPGLERQQHTTSTMRTFGELDFEGLTTISSRMSELQIRKESKHNINYSTDRGEYSNAYKLRMEKSEQNRDDPNIFPPVTTATKNRTKKTANTGKKEGNKIENEDEADDDDDDGDDDDDDVSDSDDDDYGDDDNDCCDDNESGDDENDDSVDEDDSGDDDDESNTDKGYSNTKNSSTNSNKNKKKLGEERKLKAKTVKSTLKIFKKSKTIQDSVEHGRQWKDDSEEMSTAGRSAEESSASTTTGTSDTSRSALQLDLAAFLRNESPEAEDQENRNVTEGGEEEDRIRNTKKHKQSDEADLDIVNKLQHIREPEKQANIPQKLVDSVSPRADEDLLELMVRIAENPSEWQRVHRVLQQLDQDIVTSKKSLLAAKSLRKSKSREEKKTEGEEKAIHVFSNKNKEKMQHRKYQQAEKKKKKKKQRQKEKLKATEENEVPTFKAKSKEEIRREELEKAGVLAPANAVLKDNEKGEISKVFKQKSISKIKYNSLPSLNSANIRDRNQNHKINFDKETKENNNEWSIMQAQKVGNDHTSSIDSAIAYLSEPGQSLAHLYNTKLPSPTKSTNVREKYEKSESLQDIATDINRTNTWSKPSVDWRHNRNKLYDSFSNSKFDQEVDSSRTKSEDWIKTPSGLENIHGETGTKNIVGTPSFSGSFDKSTPENRMPHFRASLDKDASENTMPAFERSLDKIIPQNKAQSSRELHTGITRWYNLNPKQERRYYGGDTVYNNPNKAWPKFSIESLKHGNLAENLKTWPDLPIDQSIDSNKEDYNIQETSDNWPNFPRGTHIPVQHPNSYNWPKYSDDTTSLNSITSSAWSKSSLDPSVPEQTQMNKNAWSHIKHPHQKPVPPIDTTLAHHTKEASGSKQGPHFAYHRVTSSPQILAQQQQKEAQQRARHGNAYIAVSVIAPPGKSKGLNKPHNKTNGSQLQTPKKEVNNVNMPQTIPPATPFPDKMDQLLAMRSEKQKFRGGEDLLEEQLVDMAVAGQQQQRSTIPWSHARHLDKIQEQLKTLSDMGEKLRYRWLEKERLLQILRDGGKSGSGFFRSQRDENTGRESATTTTSTSIDTPNPLTSFHTTHPTSAP